MKITTKYESGEAGEGAREGKRGGMIADPERTVEWLGSINYSNLENTLGRIKGLFSIDAEAPITLLVNSFGGTTGIGMSFYDAMRTWLPANLTTIGSGDVDSSGIVVLAAGIKRYITKNTTLLLHLAGRTFPGEKRFSTADIEAMMKEDRLKDYQYACVISDACMEKHKGESALKYTPEKILELMSKNTLLTAEEAVNMGIGHAVL